MDKPNAEKTNKTSMKEKVQAITDQLEAGIQTFLNGQGYRKYLSTMSKFHNYSLNNTLLIAMQKPDATLVAGYHKWQTCFQRTVNKGEKAIKILAPVPYTIKQYKKKLDANGNPILNEEGKPVVEEVQIKQYSFKVVSVFDISQTSGEPLPSAGVNELQGDVKYFSRFLDILKEISPVPIKFSRIAGATKGYYSNATKEIVVKEEMSEVQTAKTVLHEMAHALLHSEVDGIIKDRHTKEVEAESVAFTVCCHFGIDTSEYSFGYIATWSKDRSTPELKDSLELIRKTASTLISQIEDKLNQQPCIEAETDYF